ncbi:MAG: 30S ribosomal protein S9 [Candidatus Aerophobetes bacterium]|nr:30S ribosomal protein S9 [Candidatus Aerophobetes bacterium]
MREGFYAVGRRKKATAKVKIRAGKGEFIVNGRPVEEYFSREVYRRTVREPLEEVNLLDRFDVEAKTKGGGLNGQAGAIRLGLARSMLKINPDLRKSLKKEGFLTRDPRMKERKKPGLRGARAKPQSSKR